MTQDRRRFVRALGSVLPLPWLATCLGAVDIPAAAEPRLLSRPGAPSGTPVTGKVTISTAAFAAVVYAPERIGGPAAVLVFLHGALRTVDVFVEGHRAGADAAGVIVVAPFAHGAGTWDAIHGDFSSDPQIIDAALAWVFDRWTVDPARVVIAGFSDGGTYALAIGRANGDLFTRVVAYSPGFLIRVPEVSQPPILITHGTEDLILPIDATSRRIVPALRAAGYTVDYREFDGPHAVPMPVVAEVLSDLAPATPA